MHAIFIFLYLFYGLAVILLKRFFNISEITGQKILIIIPFNFICQVIMCIYGIVYFIIYKSAIINILKILLIISSSTILIIDLCLVALVIVAIVQTNQAYREAYQRYQNEAAQEAVDDTPTNFEEFPTLIWQSYHKLEDVECCIWMQNFKAGDIIKVLPDWFHYFHFLCIQEWFKYIKLQIKLEYIYIYIKKLVII